MFSTEHGYSRRPEVRYALEERCGSQMTAGVQDAALYSRLLRLASPQLLAYPLDIDAQLLFKDVYFLVDGQRRAAEEPRTAEGGTPHLRLNINSSMG